MKTFKAIVYTIHGLIRFHTLIGYGKVHSEPLITPIATLIVEKRDSTTESPQPAQAKSRMVVINIEYREQGIRVGSNVDRGTERKFDTTVKRKY